MAIALPPLPSLPPPPPEEEIDPRLFREHHFGLWGAQLLLAAGVVWMVVTGLRAVQERDAKRKAAEKANDQACGRAGVHRKKGRRLLVLELFKQDAKWNTQEGVGLEERKGIAPWFQERLEKSSARSWDIIPSALWTLSAQPLSLVHQRTVSQSLLARCGVDAVFSVVLARWPRVHLASNHRKKALRPPRLPKNFSLSEMSPPGYVFRTMLLFANRDLTGDTADAKGALLGRLPKQVVLSSDASKEAVVSKDASWWHLFEALALLKHLRPAQQMPKALYDGLLHRICRSLQRGGAVLAPACTLRLAAGAPSMKFQPVRLAIPEGNVSHLEDGKPKESHVPSFWMDRDEVDRASYARCVIAGRCPLIDDVFLGDWSLPRDRLRVRDAMRYCKWLGGTLPTETQWILAARGGAVIEEKPNPFPKRPYPWGEEKHDCSRANLHWCFQKERNGVKIPALLPTSRYLGDVSPYGIRMMAGNVAEMMRDGLIKGGSSFSEPHPIDWRGRIELRRGLSWVGFRCVRE
ncbi:MAG: SUMF1/EgtB/PvdO family nonheme iron enzyme [Myxococcales bacterium]|nr:SUMF1/EgtB/PvdO family nonheme iron enzyme [Myxococcales bacterium]